MAEIDWDTRLRESMDAFNRGDYEGTVAFLAEDVEYQRGANAPESRETVHGRDAVAEFFRPNVLTQQSVEVHDLQSGDRGHVVHLTFNATGAASGLPVSLRAYLVYFEDSTGEQIARIEVHDNEAAADAAAGLV